MDSPTTPYDAHSTFESRVADGFDELQSVAHEPTRSGRSRREFNVDPKLRPGLLVAFASVLQGSIERLLTERGSSRLRLDLFELSHHGSHGNITSELLELIDCDRFLASRSASNSDDAPPPTNEGGLPWTSMTF